MCGVAIIWQLEWEENGVVRGIVTKEEDEPVGTRREAGGELFKE